MLTALSALLLTSCTKSVGYVDDIPPLPSSVENGGKVTSWPTSSKGLDPVRTAQLLAQVRRNELRQARAVRDAKRYHRFLMEQRKAAKKD